MSRTLERNQNPTPGDTIILRLISWNSNNYANLQEIQKIEIFYLDPTNKSAENPDGRRLVDTIPASSINLDTIGQYSTGLVTSIPKYVIGNYIDVWHVTFRENDLPTQVTHCLELFPDLWYTSTMPAVYGFDFRFYPNRIRQGSKEWLIIQIVPNVPRATDLERYYTNLAISADLKIWIQQNCGPCLPKEEDLRMIVDGDAVVVRDKVFGYYELDTEDLDCGIYDVWFQLEISGIRKVSPKNQFQIF